MTGCNRQSSRSSSRPSDSPAAEDPYGYIIVSSAFLLMVVMWMAFYSFGIFFKPMLGEFGWTRAVTAGAFSLCSFIQGLLAIVMGWLTDRLGPRVVMIVCGLFLAAGYTLMSQVSTLWQLYLFFSIILGVGMGGSFAPVMTLTARWFIQRRGMMTGIVASGTGIGAFIGPPLADTLISGYGWRTSFAVLGLVVFVVMLLSALPLKRAPGHAVSAAAGVPGGGIQQEGMSLREAIGSMKFRVLFSMIFCLGFSSFAVMVHTAPHVTDLGFSHTTAAKVIATIGIACVAGRILFGRLLDRVGSLNAFVLGSAVMAVSLFLAAFSSSLPPLYLFALLFGFSFGICVTCESPLVADIFGLRVHGVLLGIVACGFTFGGGVGPFVAGYVFDAFGRYRAAFLLCGALSIIGLFLTRALRR